MATTYPLALSSFSLTINGVAFTNYVLARTLVLHQLTGAQINTCDFTLKAPESWRVSSTVPTISRPSVGAEVVVSVGATGGTLTPQFGGFITNVNEATIAPGRVTWGVTCADYSSLLNRVLVNKTYRGMTASQIIADLCCTYAPWIDTALVATTTRAITVISFPFMYPMECIQALTTLESQSGSLYYWSVSATKQLKFGTAATYVSPNSITDTSLNFSQLQIEPQLQQVRNRVFVQGGVALSALMQDYSDQSNSANDFWKIPFPNISMNLASGINYPTDAMSLNGLAIPVQLEGIGQINGVTVDEASWAGGAFLEYAGNSSFVRLAADTDIPAEGTHILFRFRYPVPIAVVRESVDSIATVAQLGNEDYRLVVSGHGPLYWWRLGDTDAAYSAKAYNLGLAPAVVSGPYYVATFSGSITPGVSGPLVCEQTQYGIELAGEDRIACASGVCIDGRAYTLEAWVQGSHLNPNAGIVAQYSSTNSAGVALFLDTFGQYNLVHNATTLTPNVPTAPAGSAYDHVVATYSGGCAGLYVNSRLIANAGGFPPPTRQTFGVEIGDYNDTVGNHYLRGRMADVAIYNYALSGSVVAQHYNSGRWGGVRETILNDSTLTSFEEARREADGQLALYASVITQIRFESFVSGWQVGDSVPIAVTAANTGHAYTGNATIQELEMSWIGAQAIVYRLLCSEVRFNWLDQQIGLAQPQPDQPLGAVLNQISTYQCTALIVPGAAGGAQQILLPYVVGPDWGTLQVNVGIVGMSQIPTANGGN